MHQPSALDHVRALTDRIVHWFQKEPQPQLTPQRASEGSRMVRQDAPSLQPTPSGPMRWEVDRQSSYNRLGKERAQERRKIRTAELQVDKTGQRGSDGPRFDPGDLSVAFRRRIERQAREETRSLRRPERER